MGDVGRTHDCAEYLADCLLNNRPVELPDHGYWGRDTLSALAGAALAILRHSNRWAFPEGEVDNRLVEQVYVTDQRHAVADDALLISAMIESQWGAHPASDFVPIEATPGPLDAFIEPVRGQRRVM